MKIKLIAALAAANSLASPALADELSGFRIEARAGWEGGRAKTAYPVEVQIPENDERLIVGGSDNKLSYGVEAGYDARVGETLLLGVYAGFDLSDVERCDEVFGDDLGCARTGRTITAGLRAGVPLSRSLLLYAKGGYSNGRLGFAYDSDVEEEDQLEADVARRSRSADGYHAGAGAELAFSSNLYGKVEYLFTDYGHARFVGLEDEEPDASVSTRRHQLLAGVGLRF